LKTFLTVSITFGLAAGCLVVEVGFLGATTGLDGFLVVGSGFTGLLFTSGAAPVVPSGG
jgi:hypothetical protein